LRLTPIIPLGDGVSSQATLVSASWESLVPTLILIGNVMEDRDA
jgi:hypothetical protein